MPFKARYLISLSVCIGTALIAVGQLGRLGMLEQEYVFLAYMFASEAAVAFWGTCLSILEWKQTRATTALLLMSSAFVFFGLGLVGVFFPEWPLFVPIIVAGAVFGAVLVHLTVRFVWSYVRQKYHRRGRYFWQYGWSPNTQGSGSGDDDVRLLRLRSGQVGL